jgi:hypothetical protein
MNNLNQNFKKKEIVWLDFDLSNKSQVEVVETPMKLFTVVKSLTSNYTWNVMSYRLTPLKLKL